MAMVCVVSGSLYRRTHSLSRLAWSWVGGRLAPFYIHQMHWVLSQWLCHDDSTINIVVFIIIIIIIITYVCVDGRVAKILRVAAELCSYMYHCLPRSPLPEIFVSLVAWYGILWRIFLLLEQNLQFITYPNFFRSDGRRHSCPPPPLWLRQSVCGTDVYSRMVSNKAKNVADKYTREAKKQLLAGCCRGGNNTKIKYFILACCKLPSNARGNVLTLSAI